MTAGLRAVDLLVAAYHVVLFTIWSRVGPGAAYAPWIAGLHATMALLPAALVRVRGRHGLVGHLRELYPLLALGPFWTELGLLQQLAPGESFDAQIAWLDRALFGRHLNLVWMPAMPYPLLSEVMHASYFMYYPVLFLPPLIMAVTGRREALRDMTLRLMVTYLGCYLMYLAFPVIGPAELLPNYEGPLSQGMFYRLTHAARAAGDSLGTAFPSSHAAGATTVAVLAWRWLSRPWALLLTLQGAGVLCATVYTQNHYPVDAVAGLLWTLVAQLIVVPALVRTTPARHVPVLPVPRTAVSTGGGA